MRQLFRFVRRDQTALLAVAMLALCTATLSAQSPFVGIATKISADLVAVTNIIGVVVLILAGLTMAFGSHGVREQIGGKLIGLGIASFAPQIYLWLF
jgi:TrbC/VIRB2 family.